MMSFAAGSGVVDGRSSPRWCPWSGCVLLCLCGPNGFPSFLEKTKESQLALNVSFPLPARGAMRVEANGHGVR